MNGAFNEMANFNGMAAIETPEFMVSKLDEFGSPSSYNHYSVGWAWAMNAPFQWTKQVASHWGGTRNGTIVHWPDGITEKGGLRSQFTHVIDVAPTILEAAGLPQPTMVNGVHAGPDRGHEHALLVQRRRRPRAPRPPVLRDVRQPRHLPPGLERGHQAQDAVGHGRRRHAGVRRRRVGALRRRRRRLQPVPQPRQPSSPSGWPNCSGSGSSRPPSTTCCRSTTDRPSGSTPTSPDAQRSSAATPSCSSPAWAGCRRAASSASRTSRSRSPPRSTCPTAAPKA